MAGISQMQNSLPQGARLPIIYRWKFQKPVEWFLTERGGYAPDLLFSEHVEAFGEDASLVIVQLCQKSRELLLSCGIASEFAETVYLEFADADTAYEFFRFVASDEVGIEACLSIDQQQLIDTFDKNDCFRMACEADESRQSWLQKNLEFLLELEGSWQMNHGEIKC